MFPTSIGDVLLQREEVIRKTPGNHPQTMGWPVSCFSAGSEGFWGPVDGRGPPSSCISACFPEARGMPDEDDGAHSPAAALSVGRIGLEALLSASHPKGGQAG